EAERCTKVGYVLSGDLIALGEPHELKSLPEVTPTGTRRFAVSCDDPPSALARAREISEVRDATLFGAEIHMLLASSMSPQTLISLVAPNDTHAEVREVQPSLEDVFVTLSRARLRSNAA